jgi:uncharacterized RDD family membrane protein YckC
MEPEWDQLSIDTPELVAIDMPVAGIGSRFVALLVDYLIWIAVFIALIFLFALIHPSLGRFNQLGAKWATAIFILIPFLLHWGYFTLFEAFWNGRTPGKRVARIRVIKQSGRGIGLFESMTRNFLRIVDQIPLIYAVGVVSIFLTRQHQRLGDLAAGTLVIHDRESLAAPGAAVSTRTFTAGVFDQSRDQVQAASRRVTAFEIPANRVSGLGPQDLEVLEGFFARRLDFTMETRAVLAERIATGVRSKTGLEVPSGVSTETFLEEVAWQLRDLTRIR